MSSVPDPFATLGAPRRFDVDLTALEAGFVAAAKSYSGRKGISYAAWRAVGVSPGVLKRAGISRSS